MSDQDTTIPSRASLSEKGSLASLGSTRLTSLLEDTKAAHHTYEEEQGMPDEDWIGWYAAHLQRLLAEQSVHLDSKHLGVLIKESSEAYQVYEAETNTKGATPTEWPAWYAQHMIDKA